MTEISMAPSEIRLRGYEILLRELEAVGAVRFMQQYESGRGGYMRDRRNWLTEKSVCELAEAMRQQKSEL